MCNDSCKLYILSLFPCICTECLLRIVSSKNYFFFPILWECCAIKMPMLRIDVSLESFSCHSFKGKNPGRTCECKIMVFPKLETRHPRAVVQIQELMRREGSNKSLYWKWMHTVLASLIDTDQALKGKFTQNRKFHLLTSMPMQNQRKFCSELFILWSFTAKQHCNILLNSWIRWGLVLKQKKRTQNISISIVLFRKSEKMLVQEVRNFYWSRVW